MLRGLVLLFYKGFHKLVQFFSTKTKAGYQPILSYATYAPWQSHKSFLQHYNLIKKHSLVPMYQCYELYSLVEQLQQKQGAIIEVGTWRGGSLALMALAEQNKNTPIYGCDTFTGVVKASDKDNSYKGGEHANTSLQEVTNFIQQGLQLKNVKLLAGIFPEETFNELPQTSFKLCHIDVDTYQSGKDCYNCLWPLLEKGGVMVFNDYGYNKTKGITQLVNELATNSDNVMLYNLNGNGVLVKV
jgi:O-methyltransferase